MIIGIGISYMTQCIDVKSVEIKVFKMIQTLLQHFVEKKQSLCLWLSPVKKVKNKNGSFS